MTVSKAALIAVGALSACAGGYLIVGAVLSKSSEDSNSPQENNINPSTPENTEKPESDPKASGSSTSEPTPSDNKAPEAQDTTNNQSTQPNPKQENQIPKSESQPTLTPPSGSSTTQPETKVSPIDKEQSDSSATTTPTPEKDQKDQTIIKEKPSVEPPKKDPIEESKKIEPTPPKKEEKSTSEEKPNPTVNNNTWPYKTGQMGEDYKQYLADPFNPINKEWWDISYKRWLYYSYTLNQNNDLSQPFQLGKVSGGYEEKNSQNPNKDKSINHVCAAVLYSDNPNTKWKTTTYTPEQVTENKKLFRDFWRYCTNLYSHPSLVSEKPVKYPTSTFGFFYQHYLVSTEDVNNSLFWKYKTRWFLQELPEKPKEAIFSEYYEDNKDKSPDLVPSIKDICQKAYWEQTNNFDIDGRNIIWYCSANSSKPYKD